MVSTLRPAPSDVVWTAQPKQYQFLIRREDEALYGGAAFGGKSEALLWFCLRRRYKYPRSAGLILRKTYKDLSKEGALISKSHEVLAGFAGWNGDNHRWTFPNGSVIQFGYLDNSDDRDHYQGTMWEDICWDELTQFPRLADYQFVNAFARTDIPGCKPYIRAATNPIGIGLGWVKTRFLDTVPSYQTYTEPETGRTRVFIPATLEDNPAGMALNPGYERNLESLPDPLRRALRYGDWDIFEGQVFTEWRRDLHLCRPFRIPADWTRWVAVDWGYASPFCALWFARTPDKSRLYTYRELYWPPLHSQQPGWRTTEQARRIYEASKEEGIRLVAADPSMWAKRQGLSDVQPKGIRATMGDSFAADYIEEWQRLGWHVPLVKANNNRIAGKGWVHEALHHAEYSDGRPLKLPRLQVFENCVNLIRTLPTLPYDRLKVEDVDTNAEDHPYDTLRYGLSVDNDSRQREPVIVRMEWQ